MIPIGSIAAAGATAPSASLSASGIAAPATQMSFSNLLSSGLHHVENKISAADDMVRRFALGDAIPVHQVTYALEEARLSVELMMQVRSRLVESYRDVMNMQL